MQTLLCAGTGPRKGHQARARRTCCLDLVRPLQRRLRNALWSLPAAVVLCSPARRAIFTKELCSGRRSSARLCLLDQNVRFIDGGLLHDRGPGQRTQQPQHAR